MSAYITIHVNLGKSPEFKSLPFGVDVAEFTVAVTHLKGRDREFMTSWFRVSIFGKPAEAVREWQKGDHVIVNGELELREYTAQDGAKRTSADLNGRSFTNLSRMMRSRGSGAGSAGESGGGWSEDRSSRGGDSGGSRRESSAPPATKDDLPF